MPLHGLKTDMRTTIMTPIDLNGDGLQDLVMGSANGNAEAWINPGVGANPEDATTFEFPSSFEVTDITTADINKDGVEDLIMVSAFQSVVRKILSPVSGSPKSFVQERGLDRLHG